jgi:arsenate reductase
MQLKIYHYPKCSTSNAALSFLRSQNIEPELILYCEKGLEKQEILNLMQLLKISKPLDLIKRNGLTYRHLGLAHKNLSNDEWIEVIMQNPKLLQRPIIIYDNKAVIGKNEEIIANFLIYFKNI